MRFSLSSNSDCRLQKEASIWVNLGERRERELDLNHIYSSKSEKYPRIYLVLKEFYRTEFGSATAVFQAFDGKQIHGHIYQKVFSLYNNKIALGNLFELVNVSILSINGKTQLFLDSDNVAMIILAKDFSTIKNDSLERVAVSPKEQLQSRLKRDSRKPISSTRLQLSDVNDVLAHQIQLLDRKDMNVATPVQPSLSTLEDYERLNRDLEDTFEDF